MTDSRERGVFASHTWAAPKIPILNRVKYFIGYADAKKLDVYANFFQNLVHVVFDETKYISFLIQDDELLKKYDGI